MAPASGTRHPIELSRDTRVVASPDQVSADLEGETVLLSMTDGVYYGLDGVGSFAWRQLAQPATLGAICDAIVAAYDVDEPRAWEDLLALMRDLHSHGLIVLASADRG
jgi:hypothetical protein